MAARTLTAREEAAHWREMGAAWERWECVHQYALGFADPHLLRALDPRPGERVLDAGCGIGDPSLAIAVAVAPRGQVVGVDLSASMLEVARRRARFLGIRNVRFRVADLQRFRWSGPRFDAIVSRFALMFVEDVDEALARLASSLRPGGRIAITVWGEERDNLAWSIRNAAARPFAREQEALAKRGFSPLRFGDPRALLASMRRAGFGRIRTSAARLGAVLPEPETFARMTVETTMHGLYESLRTRDRRRLLERLTRGAARYRDGNAVRIPARAWVISANRAVSRRR